MSRSVAANALAIISGLSIGLIASGFTRGESPTSVPSAGAEAAQLSAGQKRSVSLAIGDNSGYVAWARPPQGAIGAEPVADPQVPAVQAEVRTTASAAGRPPSALAANARRGRSEKALRRISPDSARLHHALRAVPNVSSAERGCIVFCARTPLFPPPPPSPAALSAPPRCLLSSYPLPPRTSRPRAHAKRRSQRAAATVPRSSRALGPRTLPSPGRSRAVQTPQSGTRSRRGGQRCAPSFSVRRSLAPRASIT
ncbi:hypothetical protein T492DRAFT_8389 [Pavlovales sp. CCMP2436]|nr:hypothetical protein T492DRAFT_8389 [Pavlovales sp. CCMP2436]